MSANASGAFASPTTVGSDDIAAANIKGLQAVLQLAAAVPRHALSVPPPPAPPAPIAQLQTALAGSTVSVGDLVALLTLGVQQQSQPQPAAAFVGASNANHVLNIGPVVGAYANDEELLVQALYESEHRGWTYRKALEGLHETNNHAAAQWKDYYLDNAQRINRQISYLRGGGRGNEPRKVAVTAKKPLIYTFDNPRVPATSERRVEEQVAIRRSSLTASPIARTAKSKPTSAAHRDVPRFPTPPPPSEKTRNGSKWTEADMEYMVKFAQYSWARNSHTTRLAICKELGKVAPHHTMWAWMGRWGSKRAYIDERINALGVSSSTGPFIVPSSADDTDAVAEDSPGQPSSSRPPVFVTPAGNGAAPDMRDADEDDDIPVERMAEGRATINDTDRLAMAQYIAQFEPRSWNDTPAVQRWERFSDVYPHRNSRSWAIIYNRECVDIDRKVARQRVRDEALLREGFEPNWVLPPALHPKGTKRLRINKDDDESYRPGRKT